MRGARRSVIREYGLRCAWACLVTVLLSGTSVSTAVAQSPGDAPQRATRAQLAARLTEVDQELAKAKSGQRVRLQQAASMIRERLDKGDFQPGDRFLLVLRQDSVRADTLVVRDSLRVAVLNLPEFSVAGVLRSELEDKLSAHVARFVRNAEVRTTLLTRVSVTGAVRNPGFYYAVPDRPINDLLTSAGGPLPEANLTKLSVTRLGRTILGGKATKRAIEQGTTLEAMNIQSGDTVHIPLKRKLNWQVVIQLAFITMSLLFASLQFLQWYYGRDDA